MSYTFKFTFLFLISFVFLYSCDSDSDSIPTKKYEKPSATFSIESENLTSTTGDDFELTATPTPEDVDSKWYVDGVQKSTSPNFKYKFTTPGTKKIRYTAKNEAGEFSKEFTVVVTDVLIVNLSIGDVSEISRRQNDELEIIALVSAGNSITHKWEVDGVVVSTDNILDGFILSKEKTYHVKYTATNAVGTYVKEFDVKILGLPLNVELSLTDKKISKLKGQQLSIEATIISGSEGAKHEWKVDGVIVSETNSLNYVATKSGSFAISYKCVNAAAEEFTYSWTLDVVVASFLLDDFENGVLDVKFKGGGSSAVVEIVNNPLTTGVNTSGKVLKITNSFASQQLNIYIKRASNPTVDITADVWNKGFDRVRFMYYNPLNVTGRSVTWKYNGLDPILTIAGQPQFGFWSYVDIELTTSQINSLTSLNLRLNDGTGTNAADIVYIDNVEFYDSSLIKY